MGKVSTWTPKFILINAIPNICKGLRKSRHAEDVAKGRHWLEESCQLHTNSSMVVPMHVTRKEWKHFSLFNIKAIQQSRLFQKVAGWSIWPFLLNDTNEIMKYRSSFHINWIKNISWEKASCWFIRNNL